MWKSKIPPAIISARASRDDDNGIRKDEEDNETVGERVLGTILYACSSPNYDMHTLVFTDKRILAFPLSKSADLAKDTAAYAGMAALALFAGGNPAGAYGAMGLVGIRLWKNLKKKMAGRPVLDLTERKLGPPELALNAVVDLPYSKVKKITIRKIWMSSTDQCLYVGAGVLRSERWSVAASGPEIGALIERTPLVAKLIKKP